MTNLLTTPNSFIFLRNKINYPAASRRGIHRNLANVAKGSFAWILDFFEASLGEFDPQRLNETPFFANHTVGARGLSPLRERTHKRRFGYIDKKFISIFVTLVVLILLNAVNAQSKAGTLTNQLNANNGADPWLTYYEGNYYLATTTWSSTWYMRKSPTLAGLKTAEPVEIYFETDPSRCCNLWAPEFHLLDGPNGKRWYFYYSSGTEGTLDNQHTHVLESESTDPLGPYHHKARIFDTTNDTWAIDGSVLTLDDNLYFLFSSWDGPFQNLFIAPMSNPWTISGPRVLISKPTYPWETQGGNTNEGPVALQHDGDTFIVYSASSCNTPNYKLGLLKLTGTDPLQAEAWEKHPEPIFERADQNGVFGPGHNGFFSSPDGTETWIAYHANDSTEAGCDGRRTTRVQKISWTGEGLPDLGKPISTNTVIAAPSGDTGVDPAPDLSPPDITFFAAYERSGAFLGHKNFILTIGYSNNADAQFVLRPGLADPEAISIESVNYPGYFVRQQDNLIVLATDDRTESFNADATWYLRPGLADEKAVSIESYALPGSFIGKHSIITALIKEADMKGDLGRKDATFILGSKE
jgi:GH43 family beta-xylosidase